MKRKLISVFLTALILFSTFAGAMSMPLSGDCADVTVSPHSEIATFNIGSIPDVAASPSLEIAFDTGAGTYPSIMGTHWGNFTPKCRITLSKMYTYPCAGTGGHSEYIAFYYIPNGTEVANESWKGYQGPGDYHYIEFDKPFTLHANVTYDYKIITGSYPQIHHRQNVTTSNGTITCTEFVDANGKGYNNWIPAIQLIGEEDKPPHIDQVISSVFNDFDGIYKIDSMVRIEVYEKFQATDIVSATIRITSASKGYDSGIKNLTLSENGSYYLFHWDTTGQEQANDYVVTVTLTDKAGQSDINSELVITLLSDPIFKEVLLSEEDVNFPGRGLPIEVVRTYHARNRWDGPLGYGWTHSYNIHLIEYPDGKVCIFEASGDVSWYSQNPDGSYQSRPFDYSTLTKTENGFQRRHKYGLVESFNAKGKLISITDPNGNQMTFGYDANDLLTSINSTSGQVTNLTYNTENRIVSITDPVERVTTYEYGVLGNLVSATNPAGYKTTYTYDSNHNLISVTDPNGHHSYFDYDEQNRLIVEYKDDGQDKLTYEYSVTEPKITVIDALDNQTIQTYNNYNKVINMTDALGDVTLFYYDEKCNLISEIDATGHKTEFTYDNKGNLLSIKNALNYTTTFTYEGTYNKVISLTDALRRTTTFDYDGRGNLLKITYPDSFYESFDYDDFGNILGLTNRRGMTLHRTYNGNGQLTSETYLNNTVYFSYDDAGNLISFTDLSGTTKYTYDILNRVTKVEYPASQIIEYDHDPVSNLINMTYPDGSVLNYTYDSADRLISINGSSGEIVKYSYDKVGRRIKKVLGNGAYTTYTYDAVGNLIEIANRKSSGEIISKFTYIYDKVNNRLSMTDSREGTYFYEYDAINQLIGYTNPSGLKETYNYDPVGNRISVSVNGNITNYSVNELNQYLQVGNTSYSHDADGNLISKTAGNETITYEWDVGDLLSRVTTPEGVIKYGYVSFGRRTSKADLRGMTKYIYAKRRIVTELNETDQALATYVYGTEIDEVLTMIRDREIYFYHLDGLGSVTDLTNNTQNIIESYKYSPYGEPNRISSVGNPYMFTGREYDADTKLYYYRARYYDSIIGRFISMDPIYFLGGINLYAYLVNNPINRDDPLGLQPPGWTNFVPAPWWSAPVWDLIFPTPTGDGDTTSGDPTFIQPSERQINECKDESGKIDGNMTNNVIAKLSVPYENSLIRGSVPIFGLACGKDFKEYRLEYGGGKDPETWTVIINSTIPKTRDVTPADLDDSADTTIIGNLGNWDTGLKNYVHLPSYPPDHPIDLNGVYTLRLVVIGKNGEIAEDRVTVEVGRVIARVLPGIAISADKKVIMKFPELSIMKSFRIFTIKHAKEFPTIPPEYKLVSNVYEFREPGEKFTKNVTLEMEYSANDFGNLDIKTLGIYTYDWEKQHWKYLKSQRKIEENKVVIQLQGITPKRAYYCILASPHPQEGSDIYHESPSDLDEILNEQERSNSNFLRCDTFEDGMGEWSNRDGEVGALVSRDNTATIDGGYCIKLTNKNFGGNFASTVRYTPFDAREYPVVEFDYKIPPDVKINFLVKVNDRWYDILVTDYPKEYKYKDLNMAGIGKIENVIADGKWHHAEFNLYEMLKTKTANHVVQEMIMADWDVGGFMKLEFGKNRKNATYYIDNFVIRKELPTTRDENILLVNDFESNANSFTGDSGVFVNPDRKASCQMNIEKEIKIDEIAENNVLKLSWDVTKPKSFAGYWCFLNDVDASEFKYLTFWVKGTEEAKNFLVGLKDNLGHESKVYVKDYLLEELDTGWCKVILPLTDFSGISDWNNLELISICFENRIGSGKGTIYVDDVQFQTTGCGIINVTKSGIFVDPDKKTACKMEFEDGNVLKLSFDTTKPESFAGYWCFLNGTDASEFKSLTFWVKGTKGAENFLVGLKDSHGHESKVYVKDYLLWDMDGGWQRVTIPLTAFAGISDWKNIEILSICFDNRIGSGKGIIIIGDVGFERRLRWNMIETFGRADKNLLGGDRWTFEHGAATIKGAYDDRGYKISYGGNIGLDLGGGNFSYCGWGTQLRGIDASEFEGISFYIKGGRGGEKTNIYLSDGTRRACVDVEKYIPVSTDWRNVIIPLEDFSKNGVDITHLEEFQIVFEWEEMSGTVYVDDLGFI